MTEEQFEDIKSRLTKWREVRGLSVEGQKANFEVNYSKELTEFYEAKRDKNEYEMIDALCDMVIVSINAGAVLGNNYSDMLYNNITNPLKYNPIYVRGLLFELRNRGYDPYLCLLETIKELETRTGAWNEELGKWCKDLGAYTLKEAEDKVWDKMQCGWFAFEKEDDEFWYFGADDEVGLPENERGWGIVKVKKWYKADYSGCKLAEQDPF